MNSILSAKIPILIVDDHALVRAGVTRILIDEPGMLVIGEASSGGEAIEFVKIHTPDIVIMDARMPGIGGIEATLRLLAMHPKLKIIGLLAVTSGVIPSQMLRAGVRAFLTKNASVDELRKAIRKVQSGQRYVTPEAATQMAVDPFNKKGGSLFDKLSRREMQIAQMLTDVKKVSKIAEYLSLNPKTVYSYSCRIFEKLGIHSDVELAILAVKHGLADDARELDELPRIERFAG